MRQFRFLKTFLLLLLTLFVSVDAARADNECFEQDFNFIAYGTTDRVVHIRVLAFASGGYNHWASEGSMGSVRFHTFDNKGELKTDKDGNFVYEANSEMFFKYQAENGLEDNKMFAKLKDLTCTMGVIRWTDVRDGKIKTLEATPDNPASTDDFWMKKEIIDGNRVAFFAEFDWIHPDVVANKPMELFAVKFDIKDKKRTLTSDRSYTVPCLSTTSTLATPEFLAGMYNMDEYNTEIGSVTAVLMGTGTVMGYNIFNNGKKLVESKYPSGSEYIATANLMQSDSVRTISAEVEFDDPAFATDGADGKPKLSGQTRKLRTKTPLIIQPFHSIVPVGIKEYANGTINNGYNTLSWAFNNPDEEDFLKSDAFVISRGYKPDFSDQQQISTSKLDRFVRYDQIPTSDHGASEDDADVKYENVKGYFEFEDNTPEASYNPNGTLDSDKDKKYNITGFTTNQCLDEFAQKDKAAARSLMEKYLEIPVRKVYYTVERMFVNQMYKGDYSKMENRDKFCYRDSVYKTTQLPHVTDVTVEKTANWQFDHKVKVRVRLDNYSLRDLFKLDPAYEQISEDAIDRLVDVAGRNGFKSRLYTWDERASIKLVRYDIDATTPSDVEKVEYTISGYDVKLSEDSTYYYAEFEDAMYKPFINYHYGAVVDASRSRFPIINNEECKTLHPDDLFYYDHRALATSISASKGYYNDHIFVKWGKVEGQRSFIKLYRRSLDVPGSQYEQVADVTDNTTYYRDTKNVAGGKWYMYKLEVSLAHKDHVFTSTDSVAGSTSVYGEVSGKVNLKDGGTAMSGVTVTATNVSGGESVEQRALSLPITELINKQKILAMATEENLPLGKAYSLQFWTKAKGTTYTDENGQNYQISPTHNAFIVGGDSIFIDGKGKVFLNEQPAPSSAIENEKYPSFEYVCYTLSRNLEDGSFTVYIDSVNVGTIKVPATAKYENGLPFAIVSNWHVDEMRVFNRVLNAEEVSQFSKRVLSGHEAGLVAYYHFDDKPQFCNGVAADAAYQTESDAARYDLHLYSNGVKVTDESILAQMTDDEKFDVSGLQKTAVTGPDGSYVISGLSTNEGVSYTVVPTIGGTSEFVYTKTGEPQATLEFSPSRNSYSGTDFEFTSVVRFAGRVMYKNTTVPVRDAVFKINGQEVVSGNGSVIRTDQNGSFSFDVPRITMTFQVVKDGHKFQNDGYVYENGRTEEAILFTPSEDYIGLELWDNTKVRVAGRIVGGANQASKPLGMAQSENNLGDDITMVMALEGDNTSNLLYIKGEEDVKSKKETLVVNTAEEWWTPRPENPYAITTKTLLETQRLTIYPDAKTGEFYVDLLPVRYKITQLYANGYSTLFGTGETAQILDLTNAHSTLIKDSVTVMFEDQQRMLHTAYNHTYTRTYHSPVSVTYKQLTYGIEEDYYGEEKVNGMDQFGAESSIKVVERNATTGTSYLFGLPVFQQDYPYVFAVHAHEDFYYNNDSIMGRHEQVMTPFCKVSVNNGLKDSENSETIELDKDGTGFINFVAGSPTFGAAENAAIRTITFDALVDGKYYSSAPLNCILMGDRLKEGSIVTYPKFDTRIVDVLRDPPGSTSFSYVDEGTQYNFGRKYNLSFGVSLNLESSVGPGQQNVLGAVNPQTGFLTAKILTSAATTDAGNIPLPAANFIRTRNAEYVMTLNDRIQTSASPEDVGAMADVYVGATSNLISALTESYCVIDEAVYKVLAPSFASGNNRVITKGVNKDGRVFYLVTGNKIAQVISNPVSFVYSQKHILNNIIPELEAKRNSLLLNMSEQEAKRLANQTGNVYYVTDSILGVSERFGIEGTYKVIIPENGTLAYDEVSACNEQMRKWIYIIANNEQWKLQAIGGGLPYKNYSLSGNIPVSHNESNSFSDSGYTNIGMIMGIPVNLGGTAAELASGMVLPNVALGAFNAFILKGLVVSAENEKFLKPFEITRLFETTTRSEYDYMAASGKLEVKSGVQQTITRVYPSIDNWNFTDDRNLSPLETRSSGYYLAADGDSYMDVSVYRTPVDSVKNNVVITSSLGWVTGSYSDLFHDAVVSSYVFSVKGGASRPWYEPDVTKFFMPGTPFGGKTLKIDNPRLNIPQAIVSNIPQDEKAVFTLNMTNESEMPLGQKLSSPSAFILAVDDKSNPDGLKITMDGEPLTNGRQFIINPHETLTKTIELTRGRKYDYENINLVLSSADGHLMDSKPIAAHFMPTSSPVRISSPTNNWTLNTNASQDSIGYYMPIVVDGFDVTYQGFDHIEIQYKQSTKGDDSWVNLCSYYASDSLFQAATGNKAMITSGIINDFRFYGERDPMEMKYDLRAVCFSRLGTDFVTRSSDIMTGTKDTRKPRIIGMPDPKTGIVGYGDHITLSFTEPIAYNYLDQTSNFDVLGFINDNTEINNSSALQFSGTADQKAETMVDRNIRMCDFSIDMLMSAQEGNRKQVLLSHGTTWDKLTFGITEKNELFLQMNGETFVGNPHEAAEINGAMVHVGATYDNSTQTARLFFGNAFETNAMGEVLQKRFEMPYAVTGKVSLGYNQESAKENTAFAGKMLEVRLWNSELTAEEVSNYNQKVVSGYNNKMIAHWPLTQTVGNVATDEVSGANLVLSGTKWSTRQSFSLPLNKKEVPLAAEYFTRSNLSDYTLGFWFKSQTPQIAETDTVNIFSIGSTNDTLPKARIMRLQFVGNTLKYRTGQKSFDLGSIYNDGDWHHFSVSVNRSKNQAIVMIDGTLKSQFAGDDVNGLASDYAAFGDANFVGRIDDVVLYNRSTNTTYGAMLYNTIPDLTSPELKIYLPFSKVRESSQGLVEEIFSPNNMITGDKLITDENVTGDKTDWAPIRESERLSKLEFDWSSNGTDLFLHLLTPQSKINKQNVYINVRDVQDVNGNTMADAQSYAMYIDCNQLVWKEDYLSTTLNLGGEEVLTAAFTNKGSTTCHFNMTTNADWIELAYDEGSIAPNSMLENYVHIRSGLDPGAYIGIITLTDENGLSANLEVYVTVVADEPTWQIDKRFNLTSNMIGEVHIISENNDIIDDNIMDIVGAFNSNGDCVGKSYISSSDLGQGAVFMTIYGDTIMSKHRDAITFRLWRADKGAATMLTPDQEIRFTENAIFGSTTPIRLSTSDKIWQTLALKEGWNWISLNVAPDADSNLNNVFADKKLFSEADEIREGLQYSQFTDGVWPIAEKKADSKEPDDKFLLESITNGKVYQVKVANAGNYSVLGSRLTSAQKVVKLNGGNNWQQLPYPVDVTLSIKDALADYQTIGKAEVGDVIKNYNEFAILSADNTWVGSLEYFTPGTGYFIQRASNSKPCTIDFSKVTYARATAAAPARAKGISVSCNSMPIVATFDTEFFDVRPDDKLIAIVDGEKVAEAVAKDNTNLFFLSLNEEDGQKVEFAQERNGEILNISTSIVSMNANSVVGSLEKPYVVTLSDDVANIFYYDIQGYRNTEPVTGVNIVEVVRKDGSVQSFKFIKK